MYLFRYRRQGATLRGASPQCLHDQGGFPPDTGGLAWTRRRWKTCLQSVAWPEKGCAVADLCECSFTPSNPVSRPTSGCGFAGEFHRAGGIVLCALTDRNARLVLDKKIALRVRACALILRKLRSLPDGPTGQLTIILRFRPPSRPVVGCPWRSA